MDFYFTDRKFNLLGVASTDGSTDISLANEEDKLSIEDSVRTLTGSLFYGPESRKQAEAMSALGNYVLYKDESGRSVWTTIMEINNDPLAGECVFLAEDAGVDLINELVGPYTADKAYPIASYISRFTADSGFKIGVNEISNLSRKLEWESEESTALARILSIATQFDNAELEFRFEVNGLEVVERYIDIFKKRGKDERVTLYVDKDINRITTSGNLYELGTSLVGIGGTPEGQDNPINLKGYKYTDPEGRYVLGSDGIMRDTVAVQKWSRLLSNDNPTPTSSHIQRRKTYETTDKKTLCDDVLRDLKKMAEVELNYEAEIVSLPYGVKIGDTIYLVDEQGDLYLSARVLELVRCYSEDRYLATLGNYLIKDSGVDVNLQEIADKLKDQIKPGDTYYPWTRYADDANGTGMSSVPDGKTYMATVYRKNDPIASDDPADYAGLWVKVKGDDGEAGQTPVVHPAWSWSPDGTDRFTTVYPGENAFLNSENEITNGDIPNPEFLSPIWLDLTPLIDEHGIDKEYTISFDLASKDTTNSNSIRFYPYPGSPLPGKYLFPAKYYTVSTEYQRFSLTFKPILNDPNSTQSRIGFYGNYGSGNVPIIRKVKFEVGDTPTIYTPSPSEDYANAYPLYEGTYTDYSETASQNPADYTWRRIIGESGQDGVAGKDGVGIKSTAIQYAQSTSGTTAPTTGWTTSVPTLVKGQYLWTKTVWTYTDNSSETGYTVSYNAKDGNTGKDGIAGKDGVGISDTVIEYVGAVSGTSKPTSGWSTTIPTVPQGQYLWTRTTWTYTDGTTEQGYSAALMGPKGDKGDTGDNGQTPVVHQVWSWSADGTDRFTTVYPNENLFPGSKATLTEVTWSGYEYGMLLIDLTKINYKQGDRIFYSYYADNTKGTVLLTATMFFYSSSGTLIKTSTPQKNVEIGAKGYAESDSIIPDNAVSIGVPKIRKTAGGLSTASYSQNKLELLSKTIYTPAPSEDYANAYPKYRGEYTDFTEADSTNPDDYTWTVYLGQDGNNGADGVGIANTKIDYQLHTSATTPPTGTWVASPPAVTVGKYLWTRTILEYTDGTKATPAYSVSGGPGANGSDGKDGQDGAPGVDALPIFSGYVTNEAIVLMATNSGAVSDFCKATGTFVTYLGQDQLTSGVTYSRVSQSGVTATINTTTGAYSVTAASADSGMVVFKAVYQGIELQKIVSVTKAKQGADGATGDTGPQGPPTGIVAQDTVPSSPYVGMLWQNTGNVSGYISNATYRWNGSAWEIYQFTAQNIMAETFTGFVFRGVEFIGSKFVSEFDIPLGAEVGAHAVGQTVIENGEIVTDMVEYWSEGSGDITASYDKHLEYSPANGVYMSYKGRRSNVSQEAQLAPGGLRLKVTGFEGTLTAEVLEQMNNCGKVLWEGAMYLTNNHTVTPSIPISKCLNGWTLVWSRYNPGFGPDDSRFKYTTVPKGHIASFPGKGITEVFIAPASETNNVGVGPATKYFYVTDTTIKGYAANSVSPGNGWCIRMVVAW